MLKRLFVVLFSVILITGCNSSEKLLQKGEYDRAIEKAVKKLRKDPGDDKELYVFGLLIITLEMPLPYVLTIRSEYCGMSFASILL